MRTVLAATFVALALLWVAGEQHRGNCIREGRTACSVLPWSAGHKSQSAATDLQRLTQKYGLGR